MKFKRLAAALLSAAMVVSLAACSNNKESAESGSGTTGTEAVHVNLAESWGFEYFYTILTPKYLPASTILPITSPVSMIRW